MTMQFGLDFLGLADNDWKIKPTIKNFPPGWWLGVFARVFGDPMPKVRKLLESGKVIGLRVQLDYNKGKTLPLPAFIRSEAPRWNQVALDFPNIPVVVSPSCEYTNEPAAELKGILELTASLCPNCQVIQSPGKDRVTVPGYDIEEHGNRAKTGSQFLSTDGENVYDMCDKMDLNKGAADWIERHGATAKVCFLWGARFNLIEAHNTLNPKARFAAPEMKYITGVAAHAFVKANPMEGCSVVPPFQYQPMKKPRLYKTFAEDQQGPQDGRENNPMIMTPFKGDFVDIVTWDNKRICRMPRFNDPNVVKEQRYYFPKKYAWELGEKARVLSGCVLGWLKEGKGAEAKYFGPFDMRYRNPFFQVPK